MRREVWTGGEATGRRRDRPSLWAVLLLIASIVFATSMAWLAFA